MISSNFVVILDANVLYPAPLRDLLLTLATKNLFRAKWTDRINEEWKINLLNSRSDLDPQKVDRTIELMNLAVPDCLVNGYEDLASSIKLPDENDRHVFAAAIAANAQVIVTFNLRDFPEDSLNSFDIEAQNPDDFLLHLLSLNRDKVLDALDEMRGRLRNPRKSEEEFMVTLKNQNIPNFVEKVVALKRHLGK